MNYKIDQADLHRHMCLEINYCLHGTAAGSPVRCFTGCVKLSTLFVPILAQLAQAFNEVIL